MQDNPTGWKIPKELIDNNDQWEIFAAAVRVRLTTLRSQFKSKVCTLDFVLRYYLSI
jgi:hypothetical protein